MNTLPVILGATLVEVTHTARGVVVGCPGCGAQEFFAPTDEPVLAHLTTKCPVFLAVIAARRAFIDTSGSAWLA